MKAGPFALPVRYQDILARVAKLDAQDRENLAPLVGELRRAIDLAHPHG